MRNLILFLIFVLFVSGCIGQEQTTTTTLHAPGSTISQEESARLSLFLISSSDLDGSGWTTDGPVEQNILFIEKEIVALGWIGGYEIIFKKGNPAGSDFLEFGQSVSLYPKERISYRFSIKPKVASGIKLEELADPKIGDASRAYKITDAPTGSVAYLIEFTEGDVYSSVLIAGTAQFSFETLKTTAEKAAEKIK